MGKIEAYKGICKMANNKRNVRFGKSESARKAITKQQLKDINKIYQNVYKEMEQKQKALEGKETYSAGVRKLYLEQFKKDLQAEMSKVNAQIRSIVEDGAEKVAEAVVEENNELLKSMGLYVDGAFSYVPTNAVRQIVNGNVYNGQWTLSKALWGSNQKNIKSIENIVAGGLAGNKPIKEIAKDLMFYSKSGSAKYNAIRLARTMSNHAYQKAYQMTTEKNPFVEAYQWNNGTANTCPLCIDLATQDRFGLGNGVFPKNEVPLDHPNGFCYITSIMSSRDDVDKALIDWVNGTGDAGMNQQLDEFAKDMGFMPHVVKNSADTNLGFGFKELIGGKNDAEITDSIYDYYLPQDVRDKLDKISQMKTYSQFEEYFKSKGITLDTGIESLKTTKANDEIRSVYEMGQKLVVGVETYQSEFGINALSSLKNIVLYDNEETVTAAYYFNLIGENDPKNGSIRFSNWDADGRTVFHELAHAFQDSQKAKGEDALMFADRVAKNVDFSKISNPNTSWTDETYNAEKMADAFGYGFYLGKEKNLKFIKDVYRCLKK
jgi:hypothetical protein